VHPVTHREPRIYPFPAKGKKRASLPKLRRERDLNGRAVVISESSLRPYAIKIVATERKGLPVYVTNAVGAAYLLVRCAPHPAVAKG